MSVLNVKVKEQSRLRKQKLSNLTAWMIFTEMKGQRPLATLIRRLAPSATEEAILKIPLKR
jgi:hypothetical protein